MSALLADTHVILWHLFAPSRLSPTADAAFKACIQSRTEVFVCTITLVEVRYLTEKGRVPQHYLSDLLTAIADPTTLILALPVTLDIALATEHIPRRIVPELLDRIIAATALAHNLPLVTADTRLRAAPIPTIW